MNGNLELVPLWPDPAFNGRIGPAFGESKIRLLTERRRWKGDKKDKRQKTKDKRIIKLPILKFLDNSIGKGARDVERRGRDGFKKEK